MSNAFGTIFGMSKIDSIQQEHRDIINTLNLEIVTLQRDNATLRRKVAIMEMQLSDEQELTHKAICELTLMKITNQPLRSAWENDPTADELPY